MKYKNSILIFVMFAMTMFFMVANVSAIEWDNYKTYDSETKTATIRNGLTFGSVIAEVELKSSLIVYVGEGYQKVAEFEIRAKEDYTTSLKELELFDKRKGNKKFIRNYDYKYKKVTQELVNNYSYVISESALSNGSVSRTYNQVLEGTYYKDKIEWIKLTPADLKKNDIITIGIFTNVEKGDRVEWIPNIMGVRIDEWAIWEQNLNSGLNLFLKLNETSGTKSVDNVAGKYNVTRNAQLTTNSSGIIDYGVKSIDGGKGDFDSNIACRTGDCSWSLWVNFDSMGTFGASSVAIGNDGNFKGFLIGSSYDTANRIAIWVGDGSSWSSINDMKAPATYGVNNWYHIAVTRSGTNVTLYVNGTSVKSGTLTGGYDIGGAGSTQVLGHFSGTYSLNGVMDEVGYWNRTLTGSEVSDLYNNGTGITYTNVFNTPPNITLNIPINNTNQNTNNLTFNCSATDNIGILNLSLIINDVINYTITNISANQNLSLETALIFEDSNYNWTCLGSDDEGTEGTTELRVFVIDTINPIVNIIYPSNGSSLIASTIPFNTTLNFTSSDSNLASCWFNNETSNISLTCGVNTSINLGAGYHNITYYSNDSSGNENSTISTFLINYVFSNATYTTPVLEGESQTIILNISATEIKQLNATLIYNGTSYASTASYNLTYGTLSTTLNTPSVNATDIKSFYWNYFLNNISYNTSNFNQTINLINLTVSASCPSGLSPAMYWDFKIEENLTSVNANVDYNFKFGVTNNTYKNKFGSLDNISGFYLCVNSSIYNNYTLGSGEIQYEKTGYADRRFHTFTTQRLTNTTVNNTLYFLINADATSFLFDFENTALTPYVNKYSSLLRWYPDLNQYIIVEMAKTDDKGETIMRVKVEDVDYRVGLYHQNGTIIKLLSPVRFACLSSPCSYSTLVEEIPNDYTSFFGVETSITYNTTSEIWTFTWNDPSQNTDNMTLKVTRDRGDQTFTICEVVASGFTGVLTCDSTGYTGTLRAVAYRTASPLTPITQKIINTGTTAFAGSIGLFLSFIIFLVLALIGAYSPVIAVILGIVGLFPAYILGSITLPVFIAIGVIGGIVIHFMKRTG